jgi:hypothetical protein
MQFHEIQSELPEMHTNESLLWVVNENEDVRWAKFLASKLFCQERKAFLDGA